MSATYSAELVEAARQETNERHEVLKHAVRTAAGNNAALLQSAEAGLDRMIRQFKDNLKISKTR